MEKWATGYLKKGLSASFGLTPKDIDGCRSRIPGTAGLKISNAKIANDRKTSCGVHRQLLTSMRRREIIESTSWMVFSVPTLVVGKTCHCFLTPPLARANIRPMISQVRETIFDLSQSSKARMLTARASGGPMMVSLLLATWNMDYEFLL